MMYFANNNKIKKIANTSFFIISIFLLIKTQKH